MEGGGGRREGGGKGGGGVERDGEKVQKYVAKRER